MQIITYWNRLEYLRIICEACMTMYEQPTLKNHQSNPLGFRHKQSSISNIFLTASHCSLPPPCLAESPEHLPRSLSTKSLSINSGKARKQVSHNWSRCLKSVCVLTLRKISKDSNCRSLLRSFGPTSRTHDEDLANAKTATSDESSASLAESEAIKVWWLFWCMMYSCM